MVLMCVPLLVSMVDVLVSVTGALTTKRSSFSTVRGKLFIGYVVVNWVEPYITVLSLGIRHLARLSSIPTLFRCQRDRHVYASQLVPARCGVHRADPSHLTISVILPMRNSSKDLKNHLVKMTKAARGSRLAIQGTGASYYCEPRVGVGHGGQLGSLTVARDNGYT